MHKINLPIDTKSLYYNINNDNEKGHTCTVATPIKQRNSINLDLNDVYKIPKQIDFNKYENLVHELVKNSKSIVKINNVFVFDKIKVNGKKLHCNNFFCFYIKEEIDPNRLQYGRVKLHYPINLRFADLNINNRNVINSISESLHSFAFIVESFEYDFDDDYLNFRVLIVGYNNIPYSKVFINNKGTGEKYNRAVKNYFDIYDYEIVALRKKVNEYISTEDFLLYMDKGEEECKRIAKEYLSRKGYINVRDISQIYPYSLFDFQCEDNLGNVFYFIDRFTYTKIKSFNLSSDQFLFLNEIDNSYVLLIVDLFGSNVVNMLGKNILNECFKLSFQTLRLSE